MLYFKSRQHSWRVMATANVSGDDEQNNLTKLEQLLCSPDITAGIQGQLAFISALNTFLSITAFLGNALILVAFRKESSLHPPSKVLLRNLATSDLCVGVIAEPLFVTLLVTVLNEHWNICRYVVVAVFATSYILGGVSLLTLTATSVDRLLALLLGLRYRQVVTLKRIYLTISAFWLVSAVDAVINLFWRSPIISWYDIIAISLCLVTSTFCYTKIFFTLRHHRNQVESHVQQPNQANELNIARYKKAVFTALWFKFVLVTCYLPFVVSLNLLFNVRLSSSLCLAWIYSSTLVYLNSSLNPILYCWKIDEVRQAVKDIVKQVLCC